MHNQNIVLMPDDAYLFYSQYFNIYKFKGSNVINLMKITNHKCLPNKTLSTILRIAYFVQLH